MEAPPTEAAKRRMGTFVWTGSVAISGLAPVDGFRSARPEGQ